MSNREFMPKQTTNTPFDAYIDDIPFDRRAAFKRDQLKVAHIAAGKIEDREELCDILEMIGLDVQR